VLELAPQYKKVNKAFARLCRVLGTKMGQRCQVFVKTRPPAAAAWGLTLEINGLEPGNDWQGGCYTVQKDWLHPGYWMSAETSIHRTDLVDTLLAGLRAVSSAIGSA
jgi:hypothetical protein